MHFIKRPYCSLNITVSLPFFISIHQVEILFCLYHLLLSKIVFGRSAALSSIESVGCSFLGSDPLIGIERWGEI